MDRIIPAAMVAAALALIAVPTMAQQTADTPTPELRTLLGGSGPFESGGWGALNTTYTRILDQDALLLGVRGGWLIDHRLTIGLAGYGLTTEVQNPAYDAYLVANGKGNDRKCLFRAGYGGLLIEPIIGHASVVHLSLPLIIGAGGATYDRYGDLYDDEDVTVDRDLCDYDADAFFVIEPGVELEVNVVRWMRASVGASYRYTSDVSLPATEKDVMRGFNAAFSLKFGKF